MTITTEEAEAQCQELLDHCHGQPAKVQWPHRVLHDAVATIRTLAAERNKLQKSLAGALANLADASRARGEAEGKLAASEMAGVVEQWKARAERAEAEAERLREALKPFASVPPHGVSGGPLVQAVLTYEDGTNENTARHRGCIPPEKFRAARAALEGGDKPANEKAPDR